MISRKQIKFTDGSDYSRYPYKEGAFCVADSDFYISPMKKCRIEFDWAFKEHIRYVGFGAQDLNLLIINKVFRDIEKRLKLQARTKFYRTQFAHFTIIEPAPFWREHHTNRSLFSLLLRAIAIYYRKDFNQAIEDYGLSAKVKMAINHFLDGNTESTFSELTRRDEERYPGFVAEFQGLDLDQLSQKLIKPKKKVDGGKLIL